MKDKIIPLICLIILMSALSLVIYKKVQENAAILSRSNPDVKVEGRSLLVDFDKDGKFVPYFIKGVAYHPTPIGRHPSDWGWKDKNRVDNIFDDEAILRRDFALLKDMNVNTIRIWKGDNTYNASDGRFPNRITKKTLDLAEEYGLKVIPGFWIDTTMPKCKNFAPNFTAPDFKDEAVRKSYKDRFASYVRILSQHPAILFWAIGNENNYHVNSGEPEQMSAFFSLVNEMAQVAHDVEGRSGHPVAFVNGDIKNIGKLVDGTNDINMKALDIWGANVYRGKSVGDLFDDFASRTTKPLWISEFGLDAFYSPSMDYPELGQEDQETQASWVGSLWDEIAARKDVTIGGTVMEYSDEWWKPYEWIDAGKHNAVQNHFGDGPQDANCDGYLDWYPPVPDKFIHQEWFGIVAIAKNGNDCDTVIPRKAYYALQEKFRE